MPALRTELAAAEGEADLSDAEIKERALARAFEAPLAEDLAELECAEYTDQEMREDTEMVDWEAAFEEVGEMERQKQQAHLELQLELERQKA